MQGTITQYKLLNNINLFILFTVTLIYTYLTVMIVPRNVRLNVVYVILFTDVIIYTIYLI